MSKLLCKIFRFVLNIFTQVVSAVAQAVTIVGEAVVDVLSDLFQAAGKALSEVFKTSPLLTIALIGGVAWWLFGGGDDNEKEPSTPGKAKEPSTPDKAEVTVSQGSVNV